jgi:N6-L-threonylcarbamoyladenine synthase
MTGCLGIGASAAKTLAAALNKPLVGVHHMVISFHCSSGRIFAHRVSQQAHALTALLTSSPDTVPAFPFLTLLVSGGHTLLLLATSLTNFRILATTPDQSIGRVFDKVSRMLALPWTALGPGAALEELCLSGPPEDRPADIPALPGAMPGKLIFSFTGLHSAVERFVTARGGITALDDSTKRALAREFQRAAVGQLEEKLRLALFWCTMHGVEIRHVVVSGGVASNMYLRER